MLRMNDLDDSMMAEEDLEEEDPIRFREARDGNHLLTPFQCDCCHLSVYNGQVWMVFGLA